MIERKDRLFMLTTNRTSYMFQIMETGHLEHLYYGRKIRVNNAQSFERKQEFVPGNTCTYHGRYNSVTLENHAPECSTCGKGDYEEPFVVIKKEDGSRTTDFVFENAEILPGCANREQLPGAYDEGEEAERLVISLKDRNSDVKLELIYTVFASCDVITRSACLINVGEQSVCVERLMSLQLRLPQTGLKITSFHGAWAGEMQKSDTILSSGKYVISSANGTSSSRANPFFMISSKETSEDNGTCIGMNLIYSGNHYEAIETSPYGGTRVTTGMNPAGMFFKLLPGEHLEAPEAILSFSRDGFNGLSQNMHTFVRNHIVRGGWKQKERPVLLNSWEANYFDISEKKLVKLAKKAASIGVELFVMDDGWFGNRENDKKSLGDWNENLKKLPGGLEGLAEKIKALGLAFGIWVEPEMVNTDSNLFRKYPNWALYHPSTEHSEGRNQRILDLCNPEVQDYIISEMTRVLKKADISYVKWDMNRNFSDLYSQYLSPECQGEVAHRYVLGLYRIMKTLTERFPNILFEGCSAGGNRFDLGILCFFPQIWASDNTDAYCRANIQTGYSYGYPPSVMGAHVSGCPNHQTLRNTPLETRFHIAAFGCLGYEWNLCDASKEELMQMKEQIQRYKEWRSVFQFGRFYRGRTLYNEDERGRNHLLEWTCVGEDNRAAGMLFQTLSEVNRGEQRFYARGLKDDCLYHFYNIPEKINIKKMGDLINTASPIHIKNGSFMQQMVSEFVKLPGEKEDYVNYGDALMYAGVALKQNFEGTGYNENVRIFSDFASRLYYMEEYMD